MDPEGDAATYTITGGDDGDKFDIDPTTGVLTFNAAPDFEAPTDVAGDNVYDVEVTATDDGDPNKTDVQSIAVTVVNTKGELAHSATRTQKITRRRRGTQPSERSGNSAQDTTQQSSILVLFGPHW